MAGTLNLKWDPEQVSTNTSRVNAATASPILLGVLSENLGGQEQDKESHDKPVQELDRKSSLCIQPRPESGMANLAIDETAEDHLLHELDWPVVGDEKAGPQPARQSFQTCKRVSRWIL